MNSHARRITPAVLCALAGCSRGAQERADTTPGASAAASVTLSAAEIQHGRIRWAPAETSTVSAVVEVPGQLVPNEDRTARLGAPAAGRVLQVHIQIGDRVARGAPLVTLQSPQASAALADHDKAVAELASRRAAATYARTARERAERVFSAKAIPRQDLERAQADEALARAALAQAESELGRAKAVLDQLGVDATGSMLVRSPLSGVVLSRNAQPGAVADAGAPLVTVSDPSVLWLEVDVSEQLVATLRPGATIRFTLPSFPNDTFAARVRNIGAALDSATRTVPLRAIVANSGQQLRAGTFASVWLANGARLTSVVVPESAIQLLDQRSIVFLAHAEGQGAARFERRDVEIGGMIGGQRQVLRGLAPGDTIVVEGAFVVKSELVRAKMAQE